MAAGNHGKYLKVGRFRRTAFLAEAPLKGRGRERFKRRVGVQFNSSGGFGVGLKYWWEWSILEI